MAIDASYQVEQPTPIVVHMFCNRHLRFPLPQVEGNNL
jgi:hypothetical protein